MPLHHAAWVLPIAGPPIRDGWVTVQDGRIVDLGRGQGPGAGDQETAYPESRPGHRPPGPGSCAILPGLINAHCHLELSWMRRQVPPAASMPEWVARLLALRRAAGADPPEPIADAILEMRASGTAAVGDITNSLAAWEPLADSPLSAAVFLELLGFNVPDPRQVIAGAAARLADLTPLAWLRPAIVPHAPFSVSPALLREIAAFEQVGPVSVHVGESPDEIEFLQHGTGRWRQMLEQLGVWSEGWTAPGCGPVEFLSRSGLVNDRLLAVHCVQLTDEELAALATAGATVVTCPRSNEWTGVGTPPVERFYASRVRVAVGTDSLASVDDLSMFNEMAAVRAVAPGVPAGRILRSATLDGATALGFGGDLGSIEPGKRAELIAVDVPADVADVEEYLVSGRVQPSHLRWLDAY
jgi:cytosine/adenosine deaminase-related metal-dependent hydrolase